MRYGTAAAINHAEHRSAFGKLLIDQPLMQNVLADLAIESEAATISAPAPAPAPTTKHNSATSSASRPGVSGSDDARAFRRLATAVLKYWVCKRAPAHAVEALECFGGNGYVEESGMPRLYRESPLASIWEGSGNVQCLDVLRAMVKSPESVEAFFAEVAEAAGAEPRLDRYAAALRERADRPRRHRVAGPGGSSSAWRWRSRPRCWSATATRPSPTPSAPRAWTAIGARRSGRCRTATDFGRILERHSAHL